MYTRARVLISDEDDTTWELYRELLTTSGFDVSRISIGEDPVERVAHDRPAVVVTDLCANPQHGFDLCDRLRRDPRTRDIPIVAITNHALPNDDLARACHWCRAVLMTPFVPHMLADAIRLTLQLPLSTPSIAASTFNGFDRRDPQCPDRRATSRGGRRSTDASRHPRFLI